MQGHRGLGTVHRTLVAPKPWRMMMSKSGLGGVMAEHSYPASVTSRGEAEAGRGAEAGCSVALSASRACASRARTRSSLFSTQSANPSPALEMT